MKNKTLTNALKCIVLAISWLTLSPLLLIMDGRWKLLPKWLRIVLFIISPMMIVLVLIGLVYVGYLIGTKRADLCEHLYDEAYYHENSDAKLEHLRVLSNEELSEIIEKLKDPSVYIIKRDHFAYHFWRYPNDYLQNEDYVASRGAFLRSLMAKRSPEYSAFSHPELGIRSNDVYRVMDKRCSHCFKKQLIFFEFSSTENTWRNLCGRAGPVLYCPNCNRILYYECYIMN
ncbi:MAG: hypothetical protein IJK36_08530 [Bacteroidales bacterium]|nr:hypothetical protein [Bacteroidales bacterium]MBR0540248.1 hypothetical protein [Bacteroidales bacterium]